jgi:tight adherence protein C
MLIFALFFILAAATLAALLWSGLELFRDREDPLSDRLVELQAHAMASNFRAPRKRGRGLFGAILYTISLFPGGEGWLEDTEDELAQAGIRQKQALAGYAVAQLLFLIAMIALMLWVQSGSTNGAAKMGGIISGLMLGILLPQQFLHFLVRRYRRKLQNALPDTVDLLGIVLGTGLSLDQAMWRVAEEMQFIYPELAAEFSTVVMQVKAGQERAKAFAQLVERTGVEDIKSLASMIVQSERFGTSLSQALKVYAESLRSRRRLNAEAAVAKAGVKMLFPIILFILPALFVIALVPGLLSVANELRQGLGGR